jgi:hypothetical protein
VPVWLGQTPAGNGWRYLHEDGSVEDIDQANLPPGFVPPGFEGAAPSYADATQTGAPATDPAAPALAPPQQPSLGVAPLEQPTVAPPSAPEQPVGALAPGSSTSTSTATSWRGATMPVDQAMLGSDKVSKRAYGEASKLYKAYEPSFAAEDAAVTQEHALLAQQSAAKEQGFYDEATMRRDHQEARARETAEIHQRALEWTANIQDAVNSIPTIDSRKIFHDQDSHQAAAMAIGAFMGGFLQPVLGTNTPMDIINKAVDRSVADQQAAADQAQRKVWNLKDLAERDNNDALWELNQADIMRAAHLTALERDVDAKIQGYQSDVFKAQGSKLKAQLGRARVDTFNNMFLKSRDAIETSTHNRRTESIQEQSRRDANAARLAEAEARRAGNAKSLEGRAIRSPRSGQVVGYLATGTDAQAGEYNTKLAASYNTNRNLLKLNKLVKENGSLWKKSNWGSTEKAQELRGVYNDILADIIKSKTGAAATEGEIARLEKVLPFPSKINPDTFRNIENYVSKVTDETNANNSSSLAPLEGESKLGYNFATDVDGLRAEYAANDPSVPVKSMHEGLLQLDAVRSPQELQIATRKILDVAETTAEVDSGRAAIQQAIDRLSKIPPEVRAMPTDDGQGHVTEFDPVERLQTILRLGSTVESGKKVNAADVEAERAGLGAGYRAFQDSLNK